MSILAKVKKIILSNRDHQNGIIAKESQDSQRMCKYHKEIKLVKKDNASLKFHLMQSPMFSISIKGLIRLNHNQNRKTKLIQDNSES